MQNKTALPDRLTQHLKIFSCGIEILHQDEIRITTKSSEADRLIKALSEFTDMSFMYLSSIIHQKNSTLCYFVSMSQNPLVSVEISFSENEPRVPDTVGLQTVSRLWKNAFQPDTTGFETQS